MELKCVLWVSFEYRIALCGTGSSASNTYVPDQEIWLWQLHRIVLSNKTRQSVWFWGYSIAACGHQELSLLQMKMDSVIISGSTSHCFSGHKLFLTKDGFLSVPLKIILYDFIIWRFFYMTAKCETPKLVSNFCNHNESADIEGTVFILLHWWVHWRENSR